DCGRLGRNLTNRIFRVRVQTLNVFPFALSRVIYQESIAHSSLRDGSFLEFPRSNSAMCIRKYSSMQRVACASPGMTEHASCGMKFMSFGRLTCCRSFSERALREKSPPPFLPGTDPEVAARMGNPPRITTPAAGQKIMLPLDKTIPLLAKTDGDVGEIDWFAGRPLIGKARPHEVFSWNASAGDYVLTALDDHARTGSCSVIVR